MLSDHEMLLNLTHRPFNRAISFISFYVLDQCLVSLKQDLLPSYQGSAMWLTLWSPQTGAQSTSFRGGRWFWQPVWKRQRGAELAEVLLHHLHLCFPFLIFYRFNRKQLPDRRFSLQVTFQSNVLFFQVCCPRLRFLNRVFGGLHVTAEDTA